MYMYISICVCVCVSQTYVERVEVREATHGLFQQSYRIQLRKARWILHILERIQTHRKHVISNDIQRRDANVKLPNKDNKKLTNKAPQY